MNETTKPPPAQHEIMSFERALEVLENPFQSTQFETLTAIGVAMIALRHVVAENKQ